MSTIQAFLTKRLWPQEQLLQVAENLSLSFAFVPHVNPMANYPTSLPGALALTNRRLLAAWMETPQAWKYLHIPALNYASERPLRADKPTWPYQVVLQIPGGLGLVAQTHEPDEAAGEQLAALVNEALRRFATRFGDDAALAALVAHEEAEERQRKQVEQQRND